MEIPSSAYGETVREGKMYFFKSDCPIGIKDHIHVCIKRGDTVFLFATGSSKVEKALRRAAVLGYDPATYPIFERNDSNKLTKELTYVDCNSPVEISHREFCNLLQTGKVYEMSGVFEPDSLALIVAGVRCSTVVETRIKLML